MNVTACEPSSVIFLLTTTDGSRTTGLPFLSLMVIVTLPVALFTPTLTTMVSLLR